MTPTEIESRIAALEQEVARLKAERTAAAPIKAHPARPLEQIHGTFEDDAAFREALRLGRKWRKSQDAKPRRKSKAQRK